MDDTTGIEVLRRDLEALRAENRRLTSALAAMERRLAPAGDADRSDSPLEGRPVERRHALRLFGAAAAGVGVAAVSGGAKPAAAVGTPLAEGLNAPTTPYVVNAALSDAVLQISNSADGEAVHIGDGDPHALVVDGSSLLGDITSYGSVYVGQFGSPPDDQVAVTIFDGARKGLSVTTQGPAITARGYIAVDAVGGNPTVLDAGIGVRATGRRAPLQLPFGASEEPWKRLLGAHGGALFDYEGGELVVDGAGRWWACVAPGTTSESWRLLAAPESAGAYVPIVPQRFYDSRISGNVLKADSERVVDLPATLPDGVRAVHVNVTVCNTVGAGYLAVFPSDSAWPGTSTVNWSGDNQFIANAITVKCDGKHLKLRAGTNETQIVLDLYGYYR